MLIKVFPHGQGGGSGPVNYLLRMDYPGRSEAPPTLLRGDTDMTRDLIDAQARKWKFTAGVCSWGPEDTVTPAQERQLIDDFERLAFAGMDQDQYNILWVRHSHAGHHELHFVIPRVELSTGKAFNAFPPGWRKDFDQLRDLYNWRENWTRPDAPARARFSTPDHADLHKARLIRWGKEPKPDARAEAKSAVHDYVRAMMESGQVHDRDSLIKALTDAGLEINRAGKDYVTVKDSDSGEKLRLKGGVYAADWQLGQSAERMKEKAEQERQQIESIVGDELTNLRLNLSGATRNVLNTIKSDMEGEIKNARWTLKDQTQTLCWSIGQRWLMVSLIALAAITGVTLGGWGLTKLVERKVLSLHREISQLQDQQTQLEATVKQLQAETWGLELLEAQEGRFIVLPPNTTAKTGWTRGKRQAIKVE